MPPKGSTQNASCQNCLLLMDIVKDLKATVEALKEEVEALRESMSDASHSKSFSDNQFEEVVQEMTERDRRKQNIIIFNLPEPQVETLADKRLEDCCQVRQILQITSPTVDLTDIVPIRLGKRDPAKSTPRPIKIRLSSHDIATDILKNSKKLKAKDNFSRIVMTSDKTPRQIKYYQTIKKELDERKSKGEVNLQIKYVRGLPQICVRPLN